MSFLRKDSMVYKDLGERDYAAGETIIREGDTSTEIFIIQEGKVAVTKRIGENEVFLATLQRGDFFGEMSLLESLPRNATVRALTQTRLVAIRAGELLMKFRRDPTFAFEMIQRMSSRVRQLNDQVIQLMQLDQVSRTELQELSLRTEFPEQKERK
jgi:CRP/FNR family cyclic AMP-dependent transcriptional regulator